MHEKWRLQEAGANLEKLMVRKTFVLTGAAVQDIIIGKWRRKIKRNPGKDPEPKRRIAKFQPLMFLRRVIFVTSGRIKLLRKRHPYVNVLHFVNMSRLVKPLLSCLQTFLQIFFVASLWAEDRLRLKYVHAFDAYVIYQHQWRESLFLLITLNFR